MGELFANTSDVTFTIAGPELLSTFGCGFALPRTDVVQLLLSPLPIW